MTQAVNALGFGWFQVKLSLCVGLCWMADSMEMTILSVLGPALQCDWGITRYQQALTTTIVFLGMMMSSTFWGQLSDRCGRKPVNFQINRKCCDAKYVYVVQFHSTGSDTLRNIAVLIRVFKFIGAKFSMVAAITWSSWICYWMCTTIVST